MKRFRATALLLLAGAALSLSGCEFAPTDINNLLRAPKLTGEQLAVESALKENIGPNYLLKYPQTGDDRTAFVFHDLNGDGIQEAMALYTPEGENAGTHIMVFQQNGDKWVKQCDITGDGGDVNRIAFGDYFAVGRQYLTVGWTQLNSTDLYLYVYSIRDGKADPIYGSAFSNMIVCDLDGNQSDDILLLQNDADKRTARARYVTNQASSGKNTLREASSAPMDSTVSSYAKLAVSKLSTGEPCVYVDGYKGAHSMVTEVLYWKNGALRAPLYDSQTGLVTSTLRDVAVTCLQYDNSGQMEIPLLTELPGYEKETNKLWLTRWMLLSNAGDLTASSMCFINFKAGYSFNIPKSYERTVTVQDVKGDGTRWIFRAVNKDAPDMGRTSGSELFEIRTYTKSEWAKATDKSGYIAGGDNNEYAVRVIAKPSDKLYLSQQQVTSAFRLYSPET